MALRRKKSVLGRFFKIVCSTQSLEVLILSPDRCIVSPGSSDNDAVGHRHLIIHTEFGGLNRQILVQIDDSPLSHQSDRPDRGPLILFPQNHLEYFINGYGGIDLSIRKVKYSSIPSMAVKGRSQGGQIVFLGFINRNLLRSPVRNETSLISTPFRVPNVTSTPALPAAHTLR